MAKPRFYLKDASADPARVVMVVWVTGKQVIYHTGVHVSPKNWNPKQGHIRQAMGIQWRDDNRYLSALEAYAVELIQRFRADGAELKAPVFRAELDKKFKPSKAVTVEAAKVPTFLEYFDRYILEAEKTGRHADSTSAKFRYIKSKIERFAKKTKRSLAWEEFDRSFSADLISFMNKEDNRPNYIVKTLEIFKTVLLDAEDSGMPINPGFKSKKWKHGLKKEAPFDIYLDKSELAKIAALDLSGSERLDNVRDMFLVGCYSGFRFSDSSALIPENIQTVEGVRVFVKRTKKGKQNLVIILNEDVERILAKRGGQLPRSITNQRTNEYLKELGSLAGISDMIEYTETRGGKSISKIVPKYALIETHTARRTFATNAYMDAVGNGTSIQPIMMATGHTTEGMFLKYIKASAMDVVALALKNGKIAG